MIFVTVGSNQPFDRLIRSLDDWAAAHPEQPVFAQIGAGEFLPQHMQYARSVTPQVFRDTIAEADLVVSHAGMGTVINTLQLQRPLVLLARLARYGEHTTDHQQDDLVWLRRRPGIYVADSEAEMSAAITAALACPSDVLAGLSHQPALEFAARLRAYILDR